MLYIKRCLSKHEYRQKKQDNEQKNLEVLPSRHISTNHIEQNCESYPKIVNKTSIDFTDNTAGVQTAITPPLVN